MLKQTNNAIKITELCLRNLGFEAMNKKLKESIETQEAVRFFSYFILKRKEDVGSEQVTM